MPSRSRARRLVVSGARVRFANTRADLINLSPTGALIRIGFELRRGGEWPLSLETADGRQVWLQGRVVRCRRDEGAFVLALSFVSPGAEELAVLRDLCSAPEAGAEPVERRPRPLPWRLPAFSVERLLRARWSPRRQCPECHGEDVAKEGRHSYSCLKCGCSFSGFRIGRIRVSL
jgi:hypothetical protein